VSTAGVVSSFFYGVATGTVIKLSSTRERPQKQRLRQFFFRGRRYSVVVTATSDTITKTLQISAVRRELTPHRIYVEYAFVLGSPLIRDMISAGKRTFAQFITPMQDGDNPSLMEATNFVNDSLR